MQEVINKVTVIYLIKYEIYNKFKFALFEFINH